MIARLRDAGTDIYWSALDRLNAWAAHTMDTRPPDFVIGGDDAPYLLRWYITPWRKWGQGTDSPNAWQRAIRWIGIHLPNLYLHQFRRPDDDRALHDHPWHWASLLLDGNYIEHTIAAGGIQHATVYHAGALRAHGPKFAHRIELIPALTLDDLGRSAGMRYRPCTTLFFTGIRLRDWGFHCPQKGWVPWQLFTAPHDAGLIGKGCDQ